MAGNTKFDSSAASPEKLASQGTFVNGQKRKLINGSLDISTGLRKGNDGQLLIPNANMLRGNSTYAGDAAPLDQSLILDPITMGDQRYTRSSELRRVLGMSFGATLEDCAFGNANLNSHLPVAPEKVKRLKACVQEVSTKAR